jgi:hypothetical protein
MTPQEKGIQLINKYNIVVLDTALGGSNRRVKQCALMAVDELYRIAPWSLENDIQDDSKQYWNLVKIEIEKL